MTQYQISGSAIALLGLIIFFVTPYQVGSIQSGVFPKIISGCLVVLGILVVLTSGKQEKQDGVSLIDPILLCYLIFVFIAVVLIQVIGFYPTILLSLPSFLLLFGERNFKKITVFTIVTTGMIYLIIDMILGSKLP
jgi:putative tricarboxylic transport membrane protein